MIIAAAQTVPTQDVFKNLEDHYQMIQLASSHGAELILFPELSITGYQRERAAELAFSLQDSRLNALFSLAREKNIIIVAGAPLLLGGKVFIASLIFKPDRSFQFYPKQFLHSGEEAYYFPSSANNPVIELDGDRFAFAICADINNAAHIENAAAAGCAFYLPGIFYTPAGIAEGCIRLKKYAKDYGLNILMANYGGRSWKLESGGQSSFWDKEGEFKGSLPVSGAGLLIAKRNAEGNWSTVRVSACS